MHSRRSGEILGGKYRLIRLLGKGGMGSVWAAQHLLLNAPVAVKLIDAEQLDAEALARFLGEARMAAALRSPHVVQILDYGVDGGIPHIAMELLEGESLAQRLARVGRLEPAEAARVIQHVARALGRAHEAGIVHRDLKPENVFIVSNDDEELIKVLDFGIAKGTPATLGNSAAAATRTGAMLGTPHYMSPEQLDGERSIDYRADLWSLGVLAYRCLLGELPFAGGSVGRLVLAVCSRPPPVPSQVGPVPAGFDAWFARACARDPEARFESARRAASELLVLCRAPESEPPAAGLSAGPTHATDVSPGSGATGPAASADVPTEARTRQRRVAARVGAALTLALALLGAARWSVRNGPGRDGAAAPSAPIAPTPPVVSPSEPPVPHAPQPASDTAPSDAARAKAPAPPAPREGPASRAVSGSSKRSARRASTPTAGGPATAPTLTPPARERIPPLPAADVDLGI